MHPRIPEFLLETFLLDERGIFLFAQIFFIRLWLAFLLIIHFWLIGYGFDQFAYQPIERSLYRGFIPMAKFLIEILCQLLSDSSLLIRRQDVLFSLLFLR